MLSLVAFGNEKGTNELKFVIIAKTWRLNPYFSPSVVTSVQQELKTLCSDKNCAGAIDVLDDVK